MKPVNTNNLATECIAKLYTNLLIRCCNEALALGLCGIFTVLWSGVIWCGFICLLAPGCIVRLYPRVHVNATLGPTHSYTCLGLDAAAADAADKRQHHSHCIQCPQIGVGVCQLHKGIQPGALSGEAWCYPLQGSFSTHQRHCSAYCSLTLHFQDPPLEEQDLVTN